MDHRLDPTFVSVQDMCLIIIGSSSSTHVDKLARRRLAAGGRLIVVEADCDKADIKKVLRRSIDIADMIAYRFIFYVLWHK